jgi:hypothetical protein
VVFFVIILRFHPADEKAAEYFIASIKILCLTSQTWHKMEMSKSFFNKGCLIKTTFIERINHKDIDGNSKF